MRPCLVRKANEPPRRTVKINLTMSKGEAAERSRGTKIAKQESKCRNKAAKFELRQLLSSFAICAT